MIRVIHDTSGTHSQGDVTDRPCPAITNGVNGMNSCHFKIVDDGQATRSERPEVSDPNKPPYRVPSMDEIRAIPWNGFKVASTFSGAGGSCTGYRMAGFRVVWANEFVPAAQASYEANAADDCYMDRRDIKLVQPGDIFAATGLKQGELDLFDGSPPCQAFSTAGKREEGWGQAKKYEHGASQCNETLFSQYIRLLRGLMPKTFVAENVSGLVKGTAKGYFLEILRDLKASGYRVACRVLDAKWLGVPQSRQRTIFVGVREDLGLDPVHPMPLPYLYSVRDALPWIVNIATHSGYDKVLKSAASAASAAICASGASEHLSGIVESLPVFEQVTAGNERHTLAGRRPTHSLDEPAATATVPGFNLLSTDKTVKRKFTIDELKRICAFPDDFILKGTYAQQWERLGNSVPPVMMRHIAETIRDKVLKAHHGT
ncbi:MAG: DNA cytosine methyltransferase [Planctomycetales bacterium]